MIITYNKTYSKYFRNYNDVEYMHDRLLRNKIVNILVDWNHIMVPYAQFL